MLKILLKPKSNPQLLPQAIPLFFDHRQAYEARWLWAQALQVLGRL